MSKKFILFLVALFCMGSFFIYDVISSIRSPDKSVLRFYYGPTLDDYEIYTLNDAAKLLQHPNFVHDTTHLYIHGYIENQDSENMIIILNSYLKQGSVNIVVLDWAKAVANNYITSVFMNVPSLAPVLADTIISLYNAGLSRESLTVVGHSLGAQLAGRTAREVMTKTSGEMQIYRIAALDACFPLYWNVFGIKATISLSKNDAEHVQAIHTSGWTYGQPKAIGHIDFFPNGGHIFQPGCPVGIYSFLSSEDLCSHRRSVRFWAESLEDKMWPTLLGYPVSSYAKFILSDIAFLSNPVEMGYHCPMGATGKYYLNTNEDYPYALGEGNK